MVDEQGDVVKRLHPQTLAALAAMICGDTMLQYRTALAITQFLQGADPRFPAHDGATPRRRWTLEQLQACNAAEDRPPWETGPDGASLETVILRLADPREYAGQPELLQTALAMLNRTLAPEGLMVALAGATPQLHQVRDHVAVADTVSPYLCPDFGRLTPDAALVGNLEARWAEAQRCMAAEAYLATVLLLGSILEGALLVVIKARPADANRSAKSPRDAAGKPKPFREWSLHDCIEVACERGWLRGDRLRFSHALRESRNLIHPQQHLLLGEWPNSSSCRICWEVVRAAIDDLLAGGPASATT